MPPICPPVVEVAATDWRAEIAAHHRAVSLSSRARAAHEINLTDLNARRRGAKKDPITEAMLRERKAAERRRAARKALEKSGTWEGPVCRFELFLGESHPWDGPGCYLVTFPDGTERCRGCSHLPRLSSLVATLCLHCHRSTCDHWPAVRTVRPKPREQKPERKAARKTRRERRAAG